MLSLALCSDITAISCVKNYVCIGIGNSVYVYSITTRELVAKLSVLKNNNIHGIFQGTNNKLIIYGGKSLSICELDIIGDSVNLKLCSTVQQFHDWIISAEFTKDKKNDELCILFAHNNLGIYNTTNKQICTFWCQEKCILYGGSLLPKNNQETIVFSGTVFQEILIWKVKNDCDYPEDVPILHRLKGHKGVIFSVVYDPISRMMSSTSDDRTIRLWEVKNKINDNCDEIDWINSVVSLTTTMCGHTARVWRSVIRNNKIISIGEDSLMCTWSLTGILLNKIVAHNGAQIWSIDVTEDNEMIISGGADGAINVWHFETTESLPGKIILDNPHLPWILKYVNYMKNGIVVFRDEGTLIVYDKNLKETQILSISSRFKSYCIMKISLDQRKIVLGSKDGYAEIYEENKETGSLQKVLEKKIVDSKILALHWLNDETILVCSKPGRLTFFDLIEDTKRVRSEFFIPPSRERWTTAAIIQRKLLICGDRAGSVYVFNQDQEDEGPAQIFPKIHGRLGVQSFFISGNRIISTGRDGTLRYYDNKQEEKKQYLLTLHTNKMPMDWVCKVVVHDDDLFALGFKEVEFVIYSMNLRRFVMRFDCGGGHRSWDCELMNKSMKFLYIKEKKVFEINNSLKNINKPIRNGFHTKEVYCIQQIVTLSEHKIILSAGEDCSLRLSWIDPTKLQTERYKITSLGIYEGHISNVKSLALLNIENTSRSTKNLIFTGGGRAQLKVWEISLNVDKKILNNDNVTCRELLSYMLYGTDKDRKKMSSSTNGFFADPETRFMDISALSYSHDSNFIILFVACSDGFLRIYLYDIINNILHLGQVLNSNNRCTLKVHAFIHKIDTILLTMTTDGYISFWRVGEYIDKFVENTRSGDVESKSPKVNLPFELMKNHQSGINSFDFKKFDDYRYILVTGGDDNLISVVGFNILSTNNELSVQKLDKWESSSYHSAQITGVKFVGKDCLLSTGIDQRVIIYQYSLMNDHLEIIKLREIMTFVPDVQGLTLCCPIRENDETLACVYGKGIEVIIVAENNSSY